MVLGLGAWGRAEHPLQGGWGSPAWGRVDSLFFSREERYKHLLAESFPPGGWEIRA